MPFTYGYNYLHILNHSMLFAKSLVLWLKKIPMDKAPTNSCLLDYGPKLMQRFSQFLVSQSSLNLNFISNIFLSYWNSISFESVYFFTLSIIYISYNLPDLLANCFFNWNCSIIGCGRVLTFKCNRYPWICSAFTSRKLIHYI